MIWFTSDTHLGHANIIAYCKRPMLRLGDYIEGESGSRGHWCSSWIKNQRCKEHDEFIIERWNSVVGVGDEVYHCGDFAFVKSVDQLEYYVRLLNGRIHLILGNHDRESIVCRSGMFASQTYKHQGKMIEVEQQKIFLNHTSCRTWDKSHYGSWHLYGHSHGCLSEDPHVLSFDCGVDCHDYYPISYDQVKSYLRSKKSF